MTPRGEHFTSHFTFTSDDTSPTQHTEHHRRQWYNAGIRHHATTGDKMGRKRKKPKPKTFRFTQDEQDAIRWCTTRGLWMLVEKDHYGRLWTVFSTSTGRNVGMYRPATGTCLYRGRDAVVPHWRTALAMMVANGCGHMENNR